MYRSMRPLTLSYRGRRVTFDMPGWYCNASIESIHTGKDMKVSDRMLHLLTESAGRNSPHETE